MKKSIGAETIVYPAPILIVGTYDKSGKPNVMTAAWGGICSSKPPCVTVSLRKATYSYGNIVENKAYTINIPSEKYVRESIILEWHQVKQRTNFPQLALHL